MEYGPGSTPADLDERRRRSRPQVCRPEIEEGLVVSDEALFFVEERGIEPLTFALPARRSPS